MQRMISLLHFLLESPQGDSIVSKGLFIPVVISSYLTYLLPNFNSNPSAHLSYNHQVVNSKGDCKDAYLGGSCQYFTMTLEKHTFL